jgi:hypothetical protein
MTGSTSSAPIDLKSLEAYFTDVEHLRDYFQRTVAAPALDRRLLVIHGVGGIGKSSLLAMFRLHCKREYVPVAVASGDRAKSVGDVLSDWNADLKADGINLSSFARTFGHYRAIQAEVEDQSRKMQESLGKVAKGTIETAASVIPGLGPVVGKLGGIGAEAMIDWLHGFLSKPDIDLLLDPSQKLTDDFLKDMSITAAKRRLVLILDTFEQMGTLSDWVRDLAQKLHPNVLFVLAGRAMPDWKRVWPEWLAHANVEELKPMNKRVMHELVRRYYATIRGGQPNPKQVDAIIEFARGLPMVVNSAVQLWVRYGVEDFQAVRSEVVADLVERLREGIPPETFPILEAAATVRWYDKDILGAMTGQTDIDAVYDELRRFPFVRPRFDGYALHDTVRDIFEENLRTHNREKHQQLHERAIAYFDGRLARARSGETEKLSLERLYHQVSADEDQGITLFRQMAEELLLYRWPSRLRALLNDANAYVLKNENNRQWRKYYNGRWLFVDRNFSEAEMVYRELEQNQSAEPLLRAYVLTSLSWILQKTRFVRAPDGLRELQQLIEESNRLLPPDDSKRLTNAVIMAGAYYRVGQMDKSRAGFETALSLYRERGDTYGIASLLSEMVKIDTLQGNWGKVRGARVIGLNILPKTAEKSVIYGRLLGGWAIAWIWSGQFREGEQRARQRLTIKEELGDIDRSGCLRDIGLALGMQARYEESEKFFSEAIENYAGVYEEFDASSFTLQAPVLAKQGSLKRAEDNLRKCEQVDETLRADQYAPETRYWLGRCKELAHNWPQAEALYNQCLNYRWASRHYFECAALTGLVRVKHAIAASTTIPDLLTGLEQLAQRYDYNDHLASLRLTQGCITWEGRAPTWDNGFEAALHFYQQALIHAVRYNRFLLDEVLWGGNVATPLRSIIPHCLERGEEGRHMLMALHDWWQTGINDIGTPRPDTISPIPEGISLLEAEHLARQIEPGDGLLQVNVIDKIEEALAAM